MPARRRTGVRWQWPLGLYLATWLSTLFAGTVGYWQFVEAFGTFAGVQFAIGIMTILTLHEMGHYIQARRYGVRASLPYFLPVPISPFGTMGAVIRMDSHIPNRTALFDIGISGPIAGLIPALIFCVVGIRLSLIVPYEMLDMPIGQPLLFQWLVRWQIGFLPADVDILPHPLAVAGWVGLFITSLNLLPIGQLDGGHVLYSLLRRSAHRVASLLLFLIVLAVLLFQHYAWMVMVVLLLMMGPRHPPTKNDATRLGPIRHVLGWGILLFLVIGLTPTPLIIEDDPPPEPHGPEEEAPERPGSFVVSIPSPPAQDA